MICQPCAEAADRPQMVDVSTFAEGRGTTLISIGHSAKICRDHHTQGHGCPCQHRPTRGVA